MSKLRLKCHTARSKAREKTEIQDIYIQIAGAAEKIEKKIKKGDNPLDFPIFATL